VRRKKNLPFLVPFPLAFSLSPKGEGKKKKAFRLCKAREKREKEERGGKGVRGLKGTGISKKSKKPLLFYNSSFC
jgi:hypothetical protein